LIEYDEKEHLKKFVEKIKEKVLIYLSKQTTANLFCLIKVKGNMNENLKK
jgi:hypothetical protein